MNGGAVHYRNFPEFCGRDTPTGVLSRSGRYIALLADEAVCWVD
jgi:hypothetical protein